MQIDACQGDRFVCCICWYNTGEDACDFWFCLQCENATQRTYPLYAPSYTTYAFSLLVVNPPLGDDTCTLQFIDAATALVTPTTMELFAKTTDTA